MTLRASPAPTLPACTPGVPPTLSRSQDPILAPRDRQSLPQRRRPPAPHGPNLPGHGTGPGSRWGVLGPRQGLAFSASFHVENTGNGWISAASAAPGSTSMPVPTLKLPESVRFSHHLQSFGTCICGGLFVADWCKKKKEKKVPPYIFWHLIFALLPGSPRCLLVKAAPA